MSTPEEIAGAMNRTGRLISIALLLAGCLFIVVAMFLVVDAIPFIMTYQGDHPLATRDAARADLAGTIAAGLLAFACIRGYFRRRNGVA
jgi:hypothetical protein